MNKDIIDSIIEHAEHRIDSSIEYNWTGGFDKKVFLDWLRRTIEDLTV